LFVMINYETRVIFSKNHFDWERVQKEYFKHSCK